MTMMILTARRRDGVLWAGQGAKLLGSTVNMRGIIFSSIFSTAFFFSPVMWPFDGSTVLLRG